MHIHRGFIRDTSFLIEKSETATFQHTIFERCNFTVSDPLKSQRIVFYQCDFLRCTFDPPEAFPMLCVLSNAQPDVTGGKELVGAGA